MLRTRVLTAIVLALSLLAIVFLLPAPAVAVAFTLIVVAAAWEWAGLLRMGEAKRRLYAAATLLPCAALYAAAMPPTLLGWLWGLALVFWAIAVPLWLLRKWPLRADATGCSVGWLLLLPTWAAMIDLHARSPLALLAAMALVWVADIAAYFSGRAWGRHKLAPGISPGKTWEGAIGAAAGVTIYGLVVAQASGGLERRADLLLLPLALIIATAVSIVGDLFESLAKRRAGVKDSSGLLPGHGGILDRIDSLTSTLPLLALAVRLT